MTDEQREYTTTANLPFHTVRHFYASVAPGDYVQNAAYFDRAITEVRRAASEKAWDEGTRHGVHLTSKGQAVLGLDNPYRKEQQ